MCGRSRHRSTCSWYGLAERRRNDLEVGTLEQWRTVGSDGRRVACGRATGRGSAPLWQVTIGRTTAPDDQYASPTYPQAVDAHL